MDNPVIDMLESAMKNIKGMIDVNSVVGEAIKVDNDTVVIPIAKITYGFGGGGTDIKNTASGNTDKTTFAGGIGGGTNVKAEAFLVISGGNVRIVPVNVNASTADKIVDMVPGMVDKVSGFFSSSQGSSSGETIIDEE